MKNTMMTYINQEQAVCQQILANRKINLQNFIKKLKVDTESRRIIFIATGSSANAVHSAKNYMEDLLGIEVDVKMPFLFANYQKIPDQGALLIGVSQSGKSYSTVEAMKKARELGFAHIIGLTANFDSPMAKEVENLIDIGCGEETVGFVTKGFTATVLTLMLMAVEGAFALGKIGIQRYEQEIEKLENAIRHIDPVIKKTEEWYAANRSELKLGKRFVTLAYGACVGTAMESCTKITETVRCPMSAHELEEYMHGPYLELNENHYIFFIQQEGLLAGRMQELRDYVSKTTKHCFTISSEDRNDVRSLNLDLHIEESISPLLYVIPFQILSFRLSQDKGIDLSVSIFSDFDLILKSKI